HGTYGDVDVKTASGDMSIENARNAHVKTASGDVHFETVSGILDVKTVSGDVHVASVWGNANFQSVSGDVFVHDAAGSISASSVSGDPRYEAVVNGRVELRAVSGDLGIGIRRGSRVFIDANTVSGSTSSEFELSDAPTQIAEPVEDAPLVEVYAKTV